LTTNRSPPTTGWDWQVFVTLGTPVALGAVPPLSLVPPLLEPGCEGLGLPPSPPPPPQAVSKRDMLNVVAQSRAALTLIAEVLITYARAHNPPKGLSG